MKKRTYDQLNFLATFADLHPNHWTHTFTKNELPAFSNCLEWTTARTEEVFDSLVGAGDFKDSGGCIYQIEDCAINIGRTHRKAKRLKSLLLRSAGYFVGTIVSGIIAGLIVVRWGHMLGWNQ